MPVQLVQLTRPNGKLRAAVCDPGDDCTSGLARMFSLSEFNPHLEDAIACAIEEQDIRLAIVESLIVDQADRGQGIGTSLMQEYLNDVATEADASILIADVASRQRNNMRLQDFYGQFGFAKVVFSHGHLVMATEPLATQLREACNPRREPSRLALAVEGQDGPGC